MSKFDDIRSLVHQSACKMNRISSYMRAARIDNPEVERMLESQRSFNTRINGLLRDLERRVQSTPPKPRKAYKPRVLPDSAALQGRAEAAELDAARLRTESRRLKRQIKDLQQHVVHRDRIISDMKEAELSLLDQLLRATVKK